MVFFVNAKNLTWALLMDIAKDSLRGNCFRLKGTSESEGTNGILGMCTTFPVS